VIYKLITIPSLIALNMLLMNVQSVKKTTLNIKENVLINVQHSQANQKLNVLTMTSILQVRYRNF
jgi:hypothetical protein